MGQVRSGEQASAESMREMLEERYETGKAVFDRLSEEEWKKLRWALISALAAAVLAYHYLIIFGYGNPDALAEGLLVYTGYDWALACGRWALRYMSRWLSGNVVIPGLWIPLYALCSAVSAWLICRLWDIKSPSAVCLVSVLLAVNPTVIEQSLLQYMFMAWGFSNLFSVMSVYMVCRDENPYWKLLLCPVLIALAFGLYQACLGVLCLMLCMTLILKALRGEKIKCLLLPGLKFAVAAFLGVMLYFIILRMELNRWGEPESGRLLAFSVAEIFTSLNKTFPVAYNTFFDYFFEPVFRRSLIYKFLFAMTAGAIVFKAAGLMKSANWTNTILVVLLTTLIPACANVSDIVFPYNKPVLIMQYQSILVVPFAVALLWNIRLPLPKASALCRAVTALLLAVLAWGYTVSANATYKVYEQAYQHTYAAVDTAMDMVYQLPDYQPGEPIAFAGFPDDSVVKGSTAMKIAYGHYDNLVFWEGFPGLQGGRANYLHHFFGIDAGAVPYEKFVAVLDTDEFREMNLFPQSNSVRRIDDLIIVKFEEDFELYG